MPSDSATSAFWCSFTYSDSPPSILWPMPRPLTHRCSMPRRHWSQWVQGSVKMEATGSPALKLIHPLADLGNSAGDLVAQDNPLLDPPAQHALHHKHVVVAEAAGVDLHQNVAGLQGRDVPLFNGESRRLSGFFQYKSSHGGLHLAFISDRSSVHQHSTSRRAKRCPRPSIQSSDVL